MPSSVMCKHQYSPVLSPLPHPLYVSVSDSLCLTHIQTYTHVHVHTHTHTQSEVSKVLTQFLLFFLHMELALQLDMMVCVFDLHLETG